MDGHDYSYASSQYGTSVMPALPAGKISFAGTGGPDNSIGYDGYVYNWPVALYTVRFRHYSAMHGRWLERDQEDYTDSMNLYLNVLSNPNVYIDPLGTESGLQIALLDEGGGDDCGWWKNWGAPAYNNHPSKQPSAPRPFIRDWYSGLDDACALAECVLSVLEDEELYEKMKEHYSRNTTARNHIWPNFDNDDIVKWLRDFIKRACNAKEYVPLKSFPCEGCDPEGDGGHGDTWYIEPFLRKPYYKIPVDPDFSICPKRNNTEDVLHEWMHRIANTDDVNERMSGVQSHLDQYFRDVCKFKKQQDLCNDK